jgi:hypothetical protein
VVFKIKMSKTMINHKRLGMARFIPPIKIVMTGGWFMIVLSCFTYITAMT